MKMVNTQLKGMGENIAKIGSKHLKHESAAKFSQEEKEVQDIIKSERQSISAVMHQTREETTTEDKALPMMLSQTTKGSKLSLQPTESIAPLPSVFEPPAVPAQQIPADAPDGMSTVGLGQPAKAAPVAAAARKGRVFADEAMYGEGIAGDIRRMVRGFGTRGDLNVLRPRTLHWGVRSTSQVVGLRRERGVILGM
mmetsp:Transcript_46451/g.123267  ORF Transcript_46451/g.123267 Transcript_46451/m.123267 type:complete len:196 (-) Transcript_46451:1214-1801(-)